MEARYEALEKENDFGMVVNAKLMVTGPFPCEIVLRGDYDQPGFVVEMENVGARAPRASGSAPMSSPTRRWMSSAPGCSAPTTRSRASSNASLEITW
jgi:hypothetical protein